MSWGEVFFTVLIVAVMYVVGKPFRRGEADF